MSELDDIRARRAAITPGVWYVELRDASFYEGEEYVNAVMTWRIWRRSAATAARHCGG